MPGYNKTGPVGDGPMTGRGMGFCNTANLDSARRFPGAAGSGRAMGWRRGFKRGSGAGMRGAGGRGFARRQSPDVQGYTPEDTAGAIEMLKMQAESMRDALDSINRRMQELEKTND